MMTIDLDRFVPYVDSGAPVLKRLSVIDPALDPAVAVDTLRIHATAVDRGRWFSGRDIPVEPGQICRLTASMLTDYLDEAAFVDETLPAAELVLNFWTAEMHHVKTIKVSVRAADWQTVVLEAAATENAAFARAEVRAWRVDVTVWARYFEFGTELDGEEGEFIGVGEVWRLPNELRIYLQNEVR